MTYQRITPQYRLESPGFGETLSALSEARTAQIIDNQLYGAIRAHSGGHGIIRFGNFSLLNNGNATYSALLVEQKEVGKPVVEAFINQIYVFTVNSMSWSNLSANNFYYLGVRLVENETNSSLQYKDIQTWSNTTGVIPSDGLLIATVAIDNGGNPTFDNAPDEQVIIPIWGNHIRTNTNPHGSTLYQDNIIVSGLSILQSINYNNLGIDTLSISGNAMISGNVIVWQNLVLSGNVIVQGNILYNLLQTQNLNIPGTFWVSDTKVDNQLVVSGSSVFRRNITLTSGNLIDGFDPSE
jgi:cytoskeletal protein CcmA (bactofilin family)